VFSVIADFPMDYDHLPAMKDKVIALLPKQEASYVQRLEVLHRLVRSRLKSGEIKDPELLRVIESLERFDEWA